MIPFNLSILSACACICSSRKSFLFNFSHLKSSWMNDNLICQCSQDWWFSKLPLTTFWHRQPLLILSVLQGVNLLYIRNSTISYATPWLMHSTSHGNSNPLYNFVTLWGIERVNLSEHFEMCKMSGVTNLTIKCVSKWLNSWRARNIKVSSVSLYDGDWLDFRSFPGSTAYFKSWLHFFAWTERRWTCRRYLFRIV